MKSIELVYGKGFPWTRKSPKKEMTLKVSKAKLKTRSLAHSPDVGQKALFDARINHSAVLYKELSDSLEVSLIQNPVN